MLANGKVLLEVCCGTYQDVLTAQAAGADRIELNSALELGGLTPSRGVFLKAVATGLPIAVMVRPHTASFTYSEADYETMLIDAQWFAENGAESIVFGILMSDGTIDVARSQQLIKVIGDVTPVFHKAFDLTPNLAHALETLIELRVKRVLTGGGQGAIDDNLLVLAGLASRYGRAIELLPGGGVNFENVVKILSATKTGQIHMTAKEEKIQTLVYAQPTQRLAHVQKYLGVSATNLAKMIEIINQGESYYD